MADTREVADRFHVRSADGTAIAVWAEGSGPPLVLVHGALNDHTSDARFVAALADRVTTFAIDRRGRGGSGDGQAYAIEREFEDVAAVVDAVSGPTGRPVAVWGHSFGADCAMGGAALTSRVSHLVLYEPGLGCEIADEAIEAVEAALAAGDREGALVATLARIVELTEDEIAFVRASPGWDARLAAVPVVPREIRAERDWAYRPGQFDTITAQALVLDGTASPAAQRAATKQAAQAVPGAKLHQLEGHSHIAHRTHPAAVADLVVGFVLS
ncbi:MAG: alpha/beta hydrolase [Actinomycetota bacterium]